MRRSTTPLNLKNIRKFYRKKLVTRTTTTTRPRSRTSTYKLNRSRLALTMVSLIIRMKRINAGRTPKKTSSFLELKR